jgi:hypothetical protein
VGFDGRLLWFYLYAPASAHDVLGFVLDEYCDYAVYDTQSEAPEPVRTGKGASGTWAQAFAGCGVRRLVPLGDGQVLAVRVVSSATLELLCFDRAP